MARSVNQVTLMGNLTRDPELRQTPSGQSVCSFSLALNRSYKDSNDQWVESTDYVDCVAWGQLGERIAQYMSKGRRCLVQGRIQSRSWEQEGQKRSKVEVLANDVTFLDSRGGDDGEGPGGSYGGGSESRAPARAPAGAGAKKKDTVIEDIGDEPINLDDIPF
jgi:single-strand DNA-binding protein